jgi:hypothetical protein
MKKRVMTLAIPEFLRRYLMHIVPRRFVKIRFFGLMAHKNRKENIKFARELINKDKRLKQLTSKSLEQIILEFKQKHHLETDTCPLCKSGTLIKSSILKATPHDTS